MADHGVNHTELVSKFHLCVLNGSSWLHQSFLDASHRHNRQGLLSRLHKSPSIQGRAWDIVGAQEILVIEAIVPGVRFSFCESV